MQVEYKYEWRDKIRKVPAPLPCKCINRSLEIQHKKNDTNILQRQYKCGGIRLDANILKVQCRYV